MELTAGLLRKVSSFAPAGLREWVKSQFGALSTRSTLLRMQRAGFDPRTIVDVGAYEGEFTVLSKAIFPQARILMIEPLLAKQPVLAQVAASLKGVEVRQALLGSSPQSSVEFHENETASSVLGNAEGPSPESTIKPMTTLDCVTAGTPFERSDLLKLDVQGYELEVLRGGSAVLASVEAVLLEANLLEIYAGAPLIDEVISFMARCGLQLYDICTLYRRPYDDALWQMDAMFVRSDSRLLASRRWA